MRPRPSGGAGLAQGGLIFSKKWVFSRAEKLSEFRFCVPVVASIISILQPKFRAAALTAPPG